MLSPNRYRTRERAATAAATLLLGLAALIEAVLAADRGPDAPQLAYIGPGAGIALVGSFVAVALTIFSAFLAMLTWPIRRICETLRTRSTTSWDVIPAGLSTTSRPSIVAVGIEPQ